MERLERACAFGHDRSPPVAAGCVEIGMHHPVVGRVEIRAKPDAIFTRESVGESVLALGDDA